MGRSLHFNTYGGNPMACAVGSAVLDVRKPYLNVKTVLAGHTIQHTCRHLGRNSGYNMPHLKFLLLPPPPPTLFEIENELFSTSSCLYKSVLYEA